MVMVSAHHEDAVEKQHHAKDLKQIKRPDQRGIGLEKLPDETLQRVTAYKEIKALGQGKGRATPDTDQINCQEDQHGNGFIELHRVARNTVAEIHAPWKSRRQTESVIGQAREEAAPPAYR